MPLELRDCAFFGPALPEPFVRFQLEAELHKRKLLPRSTGDEGRDLQERWEVYWRKLRALGEQGGDRRVANHVLEPLAERLGYEGFELQAEVITREGPEDGGWLLTAADGRKLRAWSVSLGTDLDAPSRRGRAYRFSPSRVAQRVLLASGERVGLLTDGEELRLLLCDPARPDSHIAMRLDRSGGWREARGVPDSYRLLLALASPDGVAAMPDLVEAARLAQSTVTKKLRLQARRAIEGFLQELLDHPNNAAIRAEWTDSAELARALWREGLIFVYRLLFVFKLESSADPARAFSFAATSLWRNTYSPNTALASLVRRVYDQGADSGGFLESGLRTLWRMFAEGMSSSELEVKPLGGMLFGKGATPLLDRMNWGERGVARLLDALLWTPGDGKTERERVHYGALDVEDLGRVYEALLELEPGITTEAMCLLRRAKLEVVVPVAQGTPYRADLASDDVHEDEADTETEDDADEVRKRCGKVAAGSKTKVQFIEEIPQGRFFLRVGLGRKASGSYYTPHPFVRFLVQETLGPQLAERSSKEDPQPGRILELKVLDPAMGSGHFLVEACRYLGEALYEACRLCDELAVQAEEQADKAAEAVREPLLARAAELRERVEDLPDPEDELVAYLPSRAAEGEESGLSQKKAEALCRRLVAVHCLYGIDKNPLAVELAKLSLWLESYAEGLPLTFMDHRLIQGDSLTGPFFEHLPTYPKSGEKLDDLFAQGLTRRLEATLEVALVHVRDLEASVGKDVADLEQKRAAKDKLDAALAPLKTLAAAWSGGVMLGEECDDAGYQALAQAVATGEDIAEVLAARPRLREMVEAGGESVAFQLAFPEVFEAGFGGFDSVLGNPPWNKIKAEVREVVRGAFPELGGKESGAVEVDMDARRNDLADVIATAEQAAERLRRFYLAVFLLRRQHDNARLGDPDMYQAFMERAADLATSTAGSVGMVLAGGLAKNPADSFLRSGLDGRGRFADVRYYTNLKRLFSDLPPVIEFCLVIWIRGNAGGTRFLDAQRTFEDLVLSEDSVSEPAVRLVDGFFSHPRDRDSDVSTVPLVRFLEEQGIHLSNDLHRTGGESALSKLGSVFPGLRDARTGSAREDLLRLGLVPCYSGRSMYQHDCMPTERSGKWDPAVDLVADLRAEAVTKLVDRVGHYRLMVRSTCGSPKTNQRSVVACILPAGSLSSHSLWVESDPWHRPTANALLAAAVLNTFLVDWQARPRIISNLSKAIMELVTVPRITFCRELLCHSALRLECTAPLHRPLWASDLGDAWRETTPKHTWPVLQGDDARWAVRAAIDAVVANEYGLDRAQYEHVLSTFSHKRYPKAPELCLAAFDELKAVGLEAFTKKHDPYWDIPLNESLPKLAMDLPIPGEKAPARPSLGPLFDGLGAEAAAPLVEPHVWPPAASEPAWMARTPIDRQVLILARIVDAHQRANRLQTLGNVKAEKIVYLVECHAGIDLERAPVREAAGPADFPRLKKAVHRGAKLHAFSVRSGAAGAGGIWSPGGGLTKRLRDYEELFAGERCKIDRIIEQLVLMDSDQAEIVATLYACWNDILARGGRPDDAAIVEDFYRWAEGKRRYDSDRLRRALDWMRDQSLVPSGTAAPTKIRGVEPRAKTRSQSPRNREDDGVYTIVTDLLDTRGLITSGDAQQATGLDAAGVRPHLKRLLDEGRAVAEGQRRGLKYRRIDG